VAPADQKIAKGKTCRISIRVSGKPRPFVTWFKDGEYIFDDGRRCFTVQENGDESLIMDNIGNFLFSLIIFCITKYVQTTTMPGNMQL